jgi:hypothetical protein
MTKTASHMMALESLCPGSEWVVRGSEILWKELLDENNIPTGDYQAINLEWISKDTPPSREEIINETARLQLILDSTVYQRSRQPEYPPLADLADALYWQSKGNDIKMAAYLAAVEAVKIKYPKGRA